MSSVNVVGQFIDHLMLEGKQLLKEHHLATNIAPVNAGQKAEANYQQLVAHCGNQVEPVRRGNVLSMKVEPEPKSIPKDIQASKTHKIEYRPRPKSTVALNSKSPTKKYYSSRRQSRGLRSSQSQRAAVNSLSVTTFREKENQLIKLPQNNDRIVIERVKIREEREEDEMRQRKKRALLHAYEQKVSNDTFRKSRQQRNNSKTQLYHTHKNKGEHVSFDNDGEMVFFTSNQPDDFNKMAAQAPFKLTNDTADEQEQQEPQIFKRSTSKPRSSLRQSRSKNRNDEPAYFNREHHKIRQARGQAFASAVLKTVNLSKISMNNTFRDGDVEHFMRRNDLFNNNHSRQTTSIPYLQPGDGTVYTELATNQVVSTQPNSDRNTQRSSSAARQRGRFSGFHKHADLADGVTRTQRQENDSEIDEKVEPRAVRTADQSRRTSFRDRRPMTSVNTGRITTTNEGLVKRLIQ